MISKGLLFSLTIVVQLALMKSQFIYYLIGGVTDTSFNIKAKSVDATAITLSLNGTNSKTYNSDPFLYYDITINNLTPDSKYIVNMNHKNTQKTFTVSTFPSNNKVVPFSFIAGSNIYSGTSSFIFDRIKSKNPKFMMILGNLYSNTQTSQNWIDYEKEYLNTFNSTYTSGLLQTTPLVYFFNDNDFEGRDGSNAKSANLNIVNEVYRRMIPSYTLPTSGIYQSFRHGNSLFLMTDTRTFLDPDQNQFFGTTQLNWLVSQLKTAALDNSINAVFITLTQVWNYVPSSYDWDMIKQNYVAILSSVSEQKKEIGDTVRNNFNFNRPTLPGFKSVMLIAGEHFLAFDDGSWNNFGSFPIAVCGPLDYWQQCRGGPYSHGSFHDVQTQYCQFDVYFNQELQNTCIKAQGVIATDKAKSVDQTVWLYDTCYPDTYKGRVNLKCPIDYKEKILNAGITIAATLIVYFLFFVLIYRLSVKSLSYTALKQE